MNSVQTNFAAALGVVLAILSPSCLAAQDGGFPVREVAPGVQEIGRIAHPRISESSGVVASRQFPGIFWTHTDGGSPKKQSFFAMRRDGSAVCEIRVNEVYITDWEDIAIDDDKHVYLADIGNNDARRSHLWVHRLDEPDPNGVVRVTRPTRSWRLQFPGAPFDCESLFIWKDHGYVVSKVFKDSRAQIFRFPLTESKEPVTLELVATTRIESPVTGADISPDGKLLGIVAKSGAFVYRIDGDVSRAGKQKPYQEKFRHEHIEGCTFVPEGLLATAESREIYLYTAPAFRGE